MKIINKISKISLFAFLLLGFSSCHDLLDELAENRAFTEETDYTNTANMILPLIGAYEEFQDRYHSNAHQPIRLC